MLLTAFFLGFFGNFHCLGMCGPLALAIPVKRNSRFARFLSVFFYNLGRIITYMLLGAGLGLIGSGIAWSGHQQMVSILLGAFMIVSVVIPVNRFKDRIVKAPIIKLTSKIKSAFSHLFQRSSFQSLLLIGILNGFIPCGLVYTALSGAIVSDTIAIGVFYMLFFGIGTMPVMMVVPYFKHLLSSSIRQKINWITPIIIVLFGVLLILRGANLGIPFLSPQVNVESNEVDCCHR